MGLTTKTRGKSKAAARTRRHDRLRKKIVGSAERPRLVVTRSARHVFVQVVDDAKGITLASASTMEKDFAPWTPPSRTSPSRSVSSLQSVPSLPV